MLKTNFQLVSTLDSVCVFVCVNSFRERKVREQNREQPHKQLAVTEPAVWQAHT